MSANADLKTSITTSIKNQESGLVTWKHEDTGFSIELIQLIPDFIRAVYAKQNFPKTEIEKIANYCVFGTIFKNTSNKILKYDVSKWRYKTKTNKTYPVKTKTQWLAQWKKVGINFSWSLFPDKGVFNVGDWQQGFNTIALKHGETFDMIFEWQLDGISYHSTLKNIQCAPASFVSEKS